MKSKKWERLFPLLPGGRGKRSILYISSWCYTCCVYISTENIKSGALDRSAMAREWSSLARCGNKMNVRCVWCPRIQKNILCLHDFLTFILIRRTFIPGRQPEATKIKEPHEIVPAPLSQTVSRCQFLHYNALAHSNSYTSIYYMRMQNAGSTYYECMHERGAKVFWLAPCHRKIHKDFKQGRSCSWTQIIVQP